MGLTHLVSGVIAGLLNANDAHHQNAASFLAKALEDRHHLAISSIVFSECLLGPLRWGDGSEQIIIDLMAKLPIQIVDVTHHVAYLAAQLRASHQMLRMPDAIVIATALTSEADVLATTDSKWSLLTPPDESHKPLDIQVLGSLI